MKATVAGYSCPVTVPEDELPEPDEIQTFEGDAASVEAEFVAFAVRFKWTKTLSVEE